ncbi:MAG: hypothetical protein C3F11_18165 [Methylocystaceae bacterium]|nr:MAG: hypothetical protein C3F11_18165 [Methylocystaceae bacterium]
MKARMSSREGRAGEGEAVSLFCLINVYSHGRRAADIARIYTRFDARRKNWAAIASPIRSMDADRSRVVLASIGSDLSFAG